jgi:uncharacterized protein
VLVLQGLLLWALGTPAWGETVQSLSRPTRNTWVVDRTGALTEETLVELDQLGSEVERRGLGQLTVAVVATTEKRPSRTFATELFNRWGIGHSRRNDGVLLFVALRDRKAEIILGDGVDTPADVARSQELMRSRIVPAFKAGDANKAVLEGARGLKVLLEQAPLNAGMAQAVMTQESPAPREPAKPHAKESQPPPREPKEFRDDEGMYVDMRTSESSAAEDSPPANSPSQPSSPPSTQADLRIQGPGGVTVQSSTSPWIWAVVGGFILLLIVANVLRRRGIACERCGSTNVKVSTFTLLEATESNDGLVEVTVRCRRCGHERTTTRERSVRGYSHDDSHHGGGHSSGRGASGSW